MQVRSRSLSESVRAAPEQRNEKVAMGPRRNQGSGAIVCVLVVDMDRGMSFNLVGGNYITGNVTLPSGIRSRATMPTKGYATSCQRSGHR